MERKLLTIQKIDAIEPIEGADNIVKARVMGWDAGRRSETLGGSRLSFKVLNNDFLLKDED
jgi:hypothetical protein